MKKILSIISVIAIICLVSGGYAIYLGNNSSNGNLDNAIVSKEGIDSSNSVDISSLNNDELKETFTNGVSNIQNPTNNLILKDTSDKWVKFYLFKNKDIYTYVLESEDLSDRYIQDAECGKFIPVGPINKPLPEGALCNGGGHLGSGGYITLKDTLSYDEAYYGHMENSKNGVYDYDAHDYKPIENNQEPPKELPKNSEPVEIPDYEDIKTHFVEGHYT